MKKIFKVIWMLLKALFYTVYIAGFAGLVTWGNILLLSDWGLYPYLGYLGVATIVFFIVMCWVDQHNSQKDTNEVQDEDLEDINKYKESLKVLNDLDKQFSELEAQKDKKNRK